MFKLDMIADDSFCHLNELMIVHDSFSVMQHNFAKNRLKLKEIMAIVVLPSANSACIKFAKTVAITALLG